MRLSRHLLIILALALLSIFPPAYADILIGRLGSLKNPASATLTEAGSEGFDVYAQKINAAGGINGQKIRVIFSDDDFNSELLVKNATNLVEQQGVVALINPFGTTGPAALVSDGLLKRDDVPLIGPFSGSLSIINADNVFPLRSSYEDEIVAITRQMKNLGQRRIAYFYYNVSQGPLFEPTFRKIIIDSGLDYVGTGAFEIDSEPSKQTQLTTLAAKKLGLLHPDAVFLFTNGPSFPIAMKVLLQELGPGVGRYTFGNNSWEMLVQQVGLSDSKGVIFSQSVPYPYSPTRGIVGEYLHDLQVDAKKFRPSFASLEGYMTAKVLVEALKRAGPNPTSSKVRIALESLGRLDLGGFIVNYSHAVHSVEPSVDITIISSNGKLLK